MIQKGDAGLEIDKERYKRNILLPEVGEEGQKKLAESRVLVVGAGGLGSPVSLYLAAAGVGTIGIADFDRVDVKSFTGNRTLERQKQNWRRSSFRAGTIRCR